jgi:ABC-type nitrate/sulfonate/bicarbonate transport system substrate-binding protein
MSNMDKVSFPYRATTHLAFLHVVGQSGAWARHGLEVNYDWQISKSDAHRAVESGEVEFVGGNHISTYGKRARGDQWVYIGQTLNSVQCKLVVRPDSGINSVADLRGKRIGTRGNHPGLNDWLFLKQRGLDVDRGDIELVREYKGQVVSEDVEQLEGPEAAAAKEKKHNPLWAWVRDRHVDAALVMSPGHLFAADAGMKIIDIEPLPMIWYTTVSSSLPFVQKHPDIVERFLKGLIEGIHFFKTHPEESIKIIQKHHNREGQLNQAQATYMYQDIAPVLDPKLYPTMAAIANVYEAAKRFDPDAAKINPMELWDMHHARRIDDSGFIDQLYGTGKIDARAARDQKDPEFKREQAKKQAEVVAAVKACGHLQSESCGCD